MRFYRIGLGALPFLLVGVVAVVAAWPSGRAAPDSPWDHVPSPPSHLDHSALLEGPFEDGPAVTRACLECHEQQARDFMETAHWLWVGHEVEVPGREGIVRIGKKNLLNNYCISVQSNWPGCTWCHAGYGWRDESFDFDDPSLVDCLVCHDTTDTYRKAPGKAGMPAESVDLLAVAKSVGNPTRHSCGICHFAGGGGDAVKHGDLDGTMFYAVERVDVHMGRHDFECITCHSTKHHEIPGHAMSVAVDNEHRLRCVDCHNERPHGEERLDAHTRTVACQSCHIPRMAVGAATKVSWDWSEAGRDDLVVDDPHLYNKKKGRFKFAQNAVPEYYWYNGLATRYLTGDPIDPSEILKVNGPLGDASDPEARIWPFKVHRGKQVYDQKNRYLMVPKTFGEGGYWTEFDWDKALRLGAEATGLTFSGEYDFVRTEMYWPLSHMVAPKEHALQCSDCHSDTGLMNWEALGYKGDPARQGSRFDGGRAR